MEQSAAVERSVARHGAVCLSVARLSAALVLPGRSARADGVCPAAALCHPKRSLTHRLLRDHPLHHGTKSWLYVALYTSSRPLNPMGSARVGLNSTGDVLCGRPLETRAIYSAQRPIGEAGVRGLYTQCHTVCIRRRPDKEAGAREQEVPRRFEPRMLDRYSTGPRVQSASHDNAGSSDTFCSHRLESYRRRFSMLTA